MPMETLEDLLEEQLQDLFSAENQLLKALPKMAKRASSPKLKKAFERHTEETRKQVERLRDVAERLEIKISGKTCKAMQGLVEEGNEVLEEDGEGPLIDAALVAAAQRVEHYEISAYGTARAMAEQLGESQVVKLLQKTLDEESKTDELLTKISQGELLPAAAEMMNGEEEEE